MADINNVGSFPISEREAEVLRTAFKGNEYLLKVMRSLFFSFEVSETDKDLVRSTFKNAELRYAVRKKLYPELSNDMPIGQVADFWMGTETQVFGAQRDTIYQSIHAKKEVLKMFRKAMYLLENPDGEKISLDYDPDRVALDDLQINLIARNIYLKSVENALYFIKMTAEQEVLSSKQIAEKNKKDSAK